MATPSGLDLGSVSTSATLGFMPHPTTVPTTAHFGVTDITAIGVIVGDDRPSPDGPLTTSFYPSTENCGYQTFR